jgi:hypothetical protein
MIKDDNDKYTAIIQRMADRLAAEYWKDLNPAEYRAAWMRFTREYWRNMASAVYYAEHHQEVNVDPPKRYGGGLGC